MTQKNIKPDLTIFTFSGVVKIILSCVVDLYLTFIVICEGLWSNVEDYLNRNDFSFALNTVHDDFMNFRQDFFAPVIVLCLSSFFPFISTLMAQFMKYERNFMNIAKFNLTLVIFWAVGLAVGIVLSYDILSIKYDIISFCLPCVFIVLIGLSCSCEERYFPFFVSFFLVLTIFVTSFSTSRHVEHVIYMIEGNRRLLCFSILYVILSIPLLFIFGPSRNTSHSKMKKSYPIIEVNSIYLLIPFVIGLFSIFVYMQLPATKILKMMGLGQYEVLITHVAQSAQPRFKKLNCKNTKNGSSCWLILKSNDTVILSESPNQPIKKASFSSNDIEFLG